MEGQIKYPEKIKIFLWERSLRAINTKDVLRRHMPFMALSPAWCSLWQAVDESLSHIFKHCPFASRFWNTLELVFLTLVSPRNVKDLLILILLGHLFKNIKALQWMNITRVFYWILWKGWNRIVFLGKSAIPWIVL